MVQTSERNLARWHKLLETDDAVAAVGQVVGPTAPLTLASPATDHFLCYNLQRPSQPTPAPVTVQDEFARAVQPGKPSLFCAPVNKKGEAPDAPDHLANLLCYKTQSPLQ